MSKKSMITASALVLSLVFCVGYFVLFVQFNKADQDSTIVNAQETATPNPPPTNQNVDPITLTWLQLGVFAKQSSVDELIQKLNADNISYVQYPKNDLLIVVAGMSTDEQAVAELKKSLAAKNYEIMEKQETIRDPDLISAYHNQNYVKVLEGLKS